MKRAFLLLVLLAAAAAATSALHGCATSAKKAYFNPNKTSEQTAQDIQECNYKATSSGFIGMGVTGGERGVEQPMRNEEIMDKCMAARGYTVD